MALLIHQKIMWSRLNNTLDCSFKLHQIAKQYVMLMTWLRWFLSLTIYDGRFSPITSYDSSLEIALALNFTTIKNQHLRKKNFESIRVQKPKKVKLKNPTAKKFSQIKPLLHLKSTGLGTTSGGCGGGYRCDATINWNINKNNSVSARQLSTKISKH